jgi:Ser/Thr protein kinase RdoA (MazF antagonist)
MDPKRRTIPTGGAADVPPDGGEAGQDESRDLFLHLTPDRVLESVEAAGLAVNPVCYPLNAYENRVYEVELADRSRVIAKFYRPTRWSAEQILEEHAFVAELAAEEIDVCAWRPFPGGGTLRTIDGIHYGLSDRRAGRAPDELDHALAERAGMLAARIHNVGAREDAPERPRLTSDFYIRRNLDWMTGRGTIPEHLVPRYREVALAIADLYDRLVEGVEIHRIHGDLHVSNLLVREGILRTLDFDDMVIGPAVQDLWLCIPGRDGEARRLRESFLEGYQRFRLFDRTTLRLIEPLRGLRIVSYSAWIARRWHDPFFPRTFSEFGTEAYWVGELKELEDALAAARAEIGEAPPLADPEEELTNADFFWDWEDDG